MTKQEAKEILKKHEAIVTDGHFVYTSGLHGKTYVSKRRLYDDVCTIAVLCTAIAKKFSGNHNIDVVVGPETGAVKLSRWTARILSKERNRKVFAISAKKTNAGFILRESDKRRIDGKHVLIVEDVLTTYGTIREVVNLVRHNGGYIIGIGALCDRSTPRIRLHIQAKPRTVSLIHMPLETWTANACPMCAGRIPIRTDLGKGAEFLAKQKTA